MVKYLNTFYAAAVIQIGWSSLAAAALINLPLSDLFLRDDSTCATNYTSCGSSFAANFCCSSDTTCLSLDEGSSVLCCPTGSNCTFIEPITCNIQSLNATANPTAPIQSTKLNDSLPTCGDGCCPFGYTCAKNSTCVLDVSTSSEANSTSASGSSTTATSMASTLSGLTIASTSTATIGSLTPTTATATPTSGVGLSSTQTETTATCSQFPAKAVVAGFFPGAVAGALAAAMIMMCRRRGTQQNRESTSQKTHRSSGGTIIGISEPIPDDENGSFRTDFLLRRKLSGRYPMPGTVQSRSKSMMRKTGTRVKSIFIGTNNHHNTAAASPEWNSATPPMPPLPAAVQVPVTPPQQTGKLAPRQPSTESIKVYSPPNMLGINTSNLGASNIRNTTFSEVMEKAGFHNAKGEPHYRVTETPVPAENSPLRKK